MEVKFEKNTFPTLDFHVFLLLLLLCFYSRAFNVSGPAVSAPSSLTTTPPITHTILLQFQFKFSQCKHFSRVISHYYYYAFLCVTRAVFGDSRFFFHFVLVSKTLSNTFFRFHIHSFNSLVHFFLFHRILF